MKRNITTPSSATCRIACGSVNRPRPNGPDGEAGGEVAQHGAEAEAAKQRYGNDDGAEKRYHMEQIACAAFDCQSSILLPASGPIVPAAANIPAKQGGGHMPVIVVANPKGGVGKTTLSTNLAGYLASRGHAVMLGDVDRQQSSRTWLDLRPAGLPRISAWETTHGEVVRPPQGHDPRRPRHARRPARQAPRRGDEAGRQGADPAAAEHLRHPRHARLHRPAARPPAQPQRPVAVVGTRTREGTISTDQLRSFLEGGARPAAGVSARHAELRAPGGPRADALGRLLVRFERDREQWEPIMVWVN